MVAVVLFVNFRLRDSRLGRAWVAIREDEVAAASMGVPLVKTKLMAYATGGALGGMAGAFLGAYFNTVNANQFQFGFSIFILAMVILGGLGSIWGVVLGAVALSFINTYFIPDVLNDACRRKLGLDFDLTQLSFGIFGFLIVLDDGAATRGPAARSEDGRSSSPRASGADEPCTRCGHERDAARAQPRRTASDAHPRAERRDEDVRRPGRRRRRVASRSRAGSIVSIIGPNGAGKTTFFNMLTGSTSRRSGGSRSTARTSPARARTRSPRMGMARTFQNIRLFATMRRSRT